MIYHTLNPTIINIGFLQIRWYSLFYIIGLAIAYYLIRYVAKDWKIKLTDEDVLDYIVYLAVGLLIGGRIFYFIFYDFSSLIKDPIEILRLWNGGMSFHGGLIGVLVFGFIFCKKHKIDFWTMADLTVIPLGIALALGRIGNFINGELFGRIWEGSLCIDYTQNMHLNNPPDFCRYPSQLVESFKNIIIFSTIWFLKDKKLPKGSLFWIFITLYGFFRFMIEFIREPDPQIGFFLTYFTMGQILCIFMLIIGAIMLIKPYIFKK